MECSDLDLKFGNEKSYSKGKKHYILKWGGRHQMRFVNCVSLQFIIKCEINYAPSICMIAYPQWCQMLAITNATPSNFSNSDNDYSKITQNSSADCSRTVLINIVSKKHTNVQNPITNIRINSRFKLSSTTAPERNSDCSRIES